MFSGFYKYLLVWIGLFIIFCYYFLFYFIKKFVIMKEEMIERLKED